MRGGRRPPAMTDHYACPGVEGKIVRAIQIYKSSTDGCEVLIEFTDDTSLSCSLEVDYTVKANLIRTGVGTPEVLRDYTG